MIGMRVREQNRIDVAHALVPQIGLYRLFALVAIAKRASTAGIHQNYAPTRRFDNGAITLPDIEKRNLQASLPVPRNTVAGEQQIENQHDNCNSAKVLRGHVVNNASQLRN